MMQVGLGTHACMLALACWTTSAQAQTSPRCDEISARAQSDAMLLIAPKLVLQELRFPKNNQIDLGTTTGYGYQFRAGLSISISELVKGLETISSAKAACRESDARATLDEALSFASDAPRLAALRAQASFLGEHRRDWQALLTKAAERLSRHVITLLEFTRLQELTDTLERKLVQIDGGVAALQAHKSAASSRRLDDLVEKYAQESARAERASANLRAHDAWGLRVTAGMIAQSPLAWYGLADLTFSLGGLLRLQQERSYERARAKELNDARYELPARVRAFRSEARVGADQARREREIVRHSVATLDSTEHLLEALDAENVAQARDTLSAERLDRQSELVFLETFIDALASAAE